MSKRRSPDEWPDIDWEQFSDAYGCHYIDELIEKERAIPMSRDGHLKDFIKMVNGIVEIKEEGEKEHPIDESSRAYNIPHRFWIEVEWSGWQPVDLKTYIQETLEYVAWGVERFLDGEAKRGKNERGPITWPEKRGVRERSSLSELAAELSHHHKAGKKYSDAVKMVAQENHLTEDAIEHQVKKLVTIAKSEAFSQRRE